MVDAGVPGLAPVWSDQHWHVFAVQGSSGLVTGPAKLVRLDGGRADVRATGPGTIVLRVRYTNRWSLTAGPACLRPGPDGWTQLQATGPGVLHLRLRVVGAQEGTCTAGAA
jgi:hypothetical protein